MNIFSRIIIIILLLFSTVSYSKKFSTSPAAPPFTNNRTEAALHSLFDPPLYFGAGTILGSGALLSGMGWGVCQLFPWISQDNRLGSECLLLSRILGIASMQSFTCAVKRSPIFSLFFKRPPHSCSAWEANKKMLSEIPILSQEDQELIHFLQKRWLAKTTGCFPFLVNWMCPAFDIPHQVHPESTNSYARDPSNKLSKTYINRVEAIKQALPHPRHFPLILTRPYNIRDYLPCCIEARADENIEDLIERLSPLVRSGHFPVIVDLTLVLPAQGLGEKEWFDCWQQWEHRLHAQCPELDLKQILCIQRLDLTDVGGIRLLPFVSSLQEDQNRLFQFLLEWVSKFGLSANRIELDRSLFVSDPSPMQKTVFAQDSIAFKSKTELASFFHSLDERWKSEHPQKTLLFKGTLQVLKDLCAHLSESQWQEAARSPTRFCALQVALGKIQQKLQLILQEDEALSFHDTVLHLEQVHADLTSFLEIFSPFTQEDFVHIFQKHLTSIPESLKPLAAYGIHSSAMTSLTGIFKAVERSVGKRPRILYGENTYFECIYASELFADAAPLLQASEQDLKDADLILAQFNPALKRINLNATDFPTAEYHVEKISSVLHKTLKAREGKPLCVAIDSTLDFSNSPRVNQLLLEFQKEIASGALNIICYRSGIKFDLFGMDNYCGAPFFMVHNRDPNWACFETLLTDPALQTDRLSINWFCLAFQNAAPYLESYRKQIFDNTHAVLNKIPPRLLSTKNVRYRVIPMESDVDPAFIDIKILGPRHQIRGGTLVGGLLTMKCLQAGLPMLYRPSIGLSHPNISVLFAEECSTIRLTIGLDPRQIDVIVDCLKSIDALNGPAE